MVLDLNNPDVRREALAERLSEKTPLVCSALAREYKVSLDTIRRDLIALERQGLVRRVRGGAVPVSRPLPPYHLRAQDPQPAVQALAEAGAALVEDGMALLLDGGTTVARLARRLPQGFQGLVVTPAPAVAVAAQERGIQTLLIGGRLSPGGAIAVGAETERAVENCAVDLCFLGACGLHPDFGLSADDPDEASLKRRMAEVANRKIVVTAAEKLGRRARHRVLSCAGIDVLVTDADRTLTAPYAEADVEIRRA